MAEQRVNITSPVGRIVMGNLYSPNTKDFDGKPLVVKTGPNAGQPRVDYFIALAIPKGAEQHWAQTPWGQQIWAVGHQAFPQAAQNPAFAWKIDDGDSQVLNKKGRKPCDNEGWKGHWILKLSGGFSPKVYRPEAGGYVQVTEDGYIKPGYFAEVAFNVSGNGNQNNAGVYLNHSMVCFRAYGPEITFGPDVNEAGFGQSPLPAGASMTPPASSIPMPSAPPNGPSAGVPPYGGAVSAPIPVVPNPQFLQVPPPAPTPAGTPYVPAAPASSIPSVAMPSPSNLPPAPPAPSGPRMTAAAQGVSLEAYKAAGWTQDQLVANGLMTL